MICCYCEINWGSVAEIVTCFLACLAFILSYFEYRNHKKQERINILSQFSIRYTTDKDICAVVKYLENLEEGKNETIPELHKIEMFMRFFEEIYCLIQVKSLKENIVYYMFGHYVLLFAEAKDKLPKELEYDKGFWVLFRNFVERMKKAKATLYKDKNNEYKINVKKIEL